MKYCFKVVTLEEGETEKEFYSLNQAEIARKKYIKSMLDDKKCIGLSSIYTKRKWKKA